jgi:membrane fusion protein, heavy metal efflux system
MIDTHYSLVRIHVLKVCSTFFLLLLFMTGCEQKAPIPEVPSKEEHVSGAPMQVQLTDQQERSSGIQWVKAQKISLPITVDTTGQVEAISSLQAQLAAPVSARVQKVWVNVGDVVSAGQPLALLKSDQVGQLQSEFLKEVMGIDADIQQAKVQTEFSKNAYNREHTLYLEKISAKADMDSAYTQLLKDQSAMQALQSKRQAIIASTQQQLSLYGVSSHSVQRVMKTRQIDPFLTIVAPRSGVVTQRKTNTGELATPDAILFTISDLSHVWLTGNVYEKDARKIRLGQPVEVTLDGYPDQLFHGLVDHIGAMLDKDTRTLEITATIANQTSAIKPNMFGRFHIQVGKRLVVAVPASSLQKQGDTTCVYIKLNDHQYEERPVKTGYSNEAYAEIVSGVEENEHVVSTGSLALKGEALKMELNGTVK